MYPIVRREVLFRHHFLWEVNAPDVARSAEPGQFVMLRLHEGGERIPLTVADYDREAGTDHGGRCRRSARPRARCATTTRRATRSPTSSARSACRSTSSKAGHVVLVGGGLGVAPVYPQLRAFKEAGNRTTGIIGFRNKDLVFWEDKFARYCDDLIVCTDDGSYGEPGFVTAALKEVLEHDKPDLVVAIGPLPMMRACVETTRPFGVKTMVSLNAIMVDGTGMCGSCRVTVGGEIKFACVDGPDFDGHQVDFQELMRGRSASSPRRRRRTRTSRTSATSRSSSSIEGKRNYKKLKDLPPHAVKMPERDALERSRNFKEVNLGYSMADALAEAERCIQCTKPTCIAGCPVGIDIPRFIRHLLVRDLDGALGVIQSRACSRRSAAASARRSRSARRSAIGQNKKTPMEPVAIGRLERFVGDNAHAPKAAPPQFERKLGKVAIVGSGPGGPRGGRRPREVRLRRHGLRGAARRRRRAAVRHPVVPPAARDHRPRGRQPEGHSA